MFKKGVIVIVKHGWKSAGLLGEVIGAQFTGPDGIKWTPVLWGGSDDPDWFKTDGLRHYRGEGK